MRQESRQPDSVLFSLGELRTIEAERAERAREARRQAEAAVEAEKRAHQAAEEQAIRHAEEQNKEKEAQQARERRRLEQERAEATFRLRHVEEQARLEAELARRRQEVALHELQRSARTPLWIGGGVVVVLLTLFAVWGVREHRRQREEARRTALEIAAMEAESRRINRSVADLEAKLVARRGAALRALPAAPAAVVAKVTPTKIKKGAHPVRPKRPKQPKRPALPLLNLDRCKGSADPLCNLPQHPRRGR